MLCVPEMTTNFLRLLTCKIVTKYCKKKDINDQPWTINNTNTLQNPKSTIQSLNLTKGERNFEKCVSEFPK